MTIDKKSTVWTCEDCGYKLSADEFEDNYVFWFCDECQTYLNNQDASIVMQRSIFAEIADMKTIQPSKM